MVKKIKNFLQINHIIVILEEDTKNCVNSSRLWSTKEVNEFSAKVLPHPPHSSGLSPTDYFLFQHFNNFLTGVTSANQYKEKPSSSTSSNPKQSIFMPTKLIDLCCVNKSAIIKLPANSIKINKYSLRYYRLEQVDS